MTPAAILAALNGALSLSSVLLPMIEQFKQEGTITPEQQAELIAKYNSLRAQADGQFSGPAWQPSGQS